MEDSQTRIVFRHNVPLNLIECYDFVKSPLCGAINLFVGVIRDTDIAQASSDHGLPIARVQKQVAAIYYESYESMAERQIKLIVRNIKQGYEHDREEWAKARVCIEIRLGHVPVREAAIIICVSSVRSKQSHLMTSQILQQIKSNVVIWKKICFADGTEQWDLEEKSEATWLGLGSQVKMGNK